MALAMPPTAWWPLLFPCLAFFYIQLVDKKGWRAFLIGWLFGCGYFVVGLYWIGNALLVPGNEFKWVWPLTIFGLQSGLAIFTGLAAWAATRLSDLRTWRGFLAFCACLAFSEWLRGHILTGYPWNLFAYAWAHTLPMVQSVSVFGAYGLNLVTILWATLAGFLILTKPPRKTVIIGAAAVVISMAAFYAAGAMRLHNEPTRFRDDVIVRLVQPNIQQQDKWNNDKVVQNLKQTVEMSASPFLPGKTYAIIWPETAVSDYLMQDINAANFIRGALMTGTNDRFLLSGTLRHETGDDGKVVYHNSLVTYDHDLMPVDSYDKSHLVPFGEYIPFQDKIPMHPFVKFSGFTPGLGLKTQTVQGLPPFSGLICYEVIFPGAVVAKNPSPVWMVNVTNDGWYGDSPGPYQHLAITMYRAVEEGLPVARAANTGVSALIDPYGRVLNILRYNVAGYTDSPLPSPVKSATLYAHISDSLFLLSLIFMICAICFRYPIKSL